MPGRFFRFFYSTTHNFVIESLAVADKPYEGFVPVMRYVVACGVGLILTISGAAGRSHDRPERVTVLFHFDGPYAEKSLTEMQRELASIMKRSAIQVNWREHDRVSSSEWFSNLVVVTFKGRCRMDPVSDRWVEPGPLAFTYSTDGAVQPFSEIDCDRIRASLRNAMWGGDYARSDMFFGRALARVLAHELYHMLAATKSHAEKGIAQPALSGSALISDQLEFSDAELDRMHAGAIQGLDSSPAAGR